MINPWSSDPILNAIANVADKRHKRIFLKTHRMGKADRVAVKYLEHMLTLKHVKCSPKRVLFVKSLLEGYKAKI